jgi:hypothetical protein
MLKLLFVELTPRNSLVTPFSIAISAIVNDPFSLFFSLESLGRAATSSCWLKSTYRVVCALGRRLMSAAIDGDRHHPPLPTQAGKEKGRVG